MLSLNDIWNTPIQEINKTIQLNGIKILKVSDDPIMNKYIAVSEYVRKNNLLKPSDIKNYDSILEKMIEDNEFLFCDIKARKVDVYHIDDTDKKLNYGNISYKSYNFNQINTEFFEKIFTSCNHNIYIYIDSTIEYLSELPNRKTQIKLINGIIGSLTVNLKLLNVSIVNHINHFDTCIEDFFVFKKCLNVVSINKVENHMIDLSYRIYKEISSKYDDVVLNKNYLITNGFPKTIRIMQTPTSTNKLKEQWWYKYYFDVPICSYGRMTQSSGTCWCNAALNLILLTPQIADILIEKWNELPKNTKQYIKKKFKLFKHLNNTNDDLTTLLFAVIYLFLIKRIKAHPRDKNFIAELAARIKGIDEHNDENYYKKLGIQYGDSYDPFYGLKVILNLLLEKNTDYMIIDHESGIITNDNDSTNKHIFTMLSKIKSKNDEISYNNFIIKMMNSTINNKCKYFSDTFNKNDSIDLWNTINQNNIKKTPKFIIVYINNCQIENGIPEKFILNDVNKVSTEDFYLESSLINPGIKHAIVGLKCNDDYYIYDSNNYVSYDDWSDNKYSNYLKTLKDNNVSYSKDVNGLFFNGLVYVK